MTRRVIKPQPEYDASYIGGWVYKTKKQTMSIESFNEHRYTDIGCPYGQVGDRLWVRETWRVGSFMDGEPLLFSFKDGKTIEENTNLSDTPDYESWYERVCIQSTEEASQAFKQGLVRREEGGHYLWDIGNSPCRWRPSIFMPRWASRLTLEITEVRVERLQEISIEDIKCEGAYFDSDYAGANAIMNAFTPKLNFITLWDSLNAKRGYGWDKNPWVWVIQFRRVA